MLGRLIAFIDVNLKSACLLSQTLFNFVKETKNMHFVLIYVIKKQISPQLPVYLETQLVGDFDELDSFCFNLNVGGEFSLKIS